MSSFCPNLDKNNSSQDLNYLIVKKAQLKNPVAHAPLLYQIKQFAIVLKLKILRFPSRKINPKKWIELRILRLLQFTPMASWFRRPGMSNIGTGLYMDQGGADSFLRMQGGDGGNNLFYHPSV
ncbi:hypothetical protein PVC01_000027400 [Plasmodium vivax]|uniref:VIR protein n=1 Tax=Plasmodium vivax TaxID=5855 RepID=A0A1G4E6M5_PLAVI|nr:hypothetical protein PVC01_000027400 [Plasmodium vivax]